MKDGGYRRTQHDGLRTWEALKLVTGFGFPGGVGYYDSEDPQAHTRPLTDRAANGDYHATGYRVSHDGKRPSGTNVVPPEDWRILILDPNTDSAAGGGIEYVGLRWYNCPPPKAAENPVLTTPADAGREGGRQPKHKQGLQEAVNEIVSRLRQAGIKPTAKTLLHYVRENAPSALDEGLQLNISKCDDMYVDGDTLNWKDRLGGDRSITKRSLDRYVKRARQPY